MNIFKKNVKELFDYILHFLNLFLYFSRLFFSTVFFFKTAVIKIISGLGIFLANYPEFRANLILSS